MGGHIFLMFNDGCQAQSTTRPMFTFSTDDGLTWSNASSIPVAKPGTGVMGTNVIIGLGRGLAVYNASLPSGLRLTVPGGAGYLYSDDHGASWTLSYDNNIGESAFARCTPGACGAAPGGKANFAMVTRGAYRGSPAAAYIRFSNDSIHWSRERLPVPISPWSNYSQAPGLIATPGGLVLSHGGRAGTHEEAGKLQGHGDGNGCDLFTSVDGANWTIQRQIVRVAFRKRGNRGVRHVFGLHELFRNPACLR